ncbi:MAG TPA: hypothetical protein PKV91_09220 [Bacillota bacterium]|jgi:hypothetical protein|nr:hypothetical protein [Bacillota bacterium]
MIKPGGTGKPCISIKKGVFILKVKSNLEWQILESFRAMQKHSSEISAYKVHVEKDLTVEAVASGDDTVIIIVRGCPLS